MSKQHRKQYNKQYNKGKTPKKIMMFFLLFFIIIASLLGGGGYLYVKAALQPVDEKANREIQLTIPIGSPVKEIAHILKENGAIKSALVFHYYVKYQKESGFQAGDYVLSTAMDIDTIIQKLKEGKVQKEAAMKFTIPEGFHLASITEVIAKETDYSETDILNKLQDRQFLKQLAKKNPMLNIDEITEEGIRFPLEGYLFPATYAFDEKNPPLEQIIAKMVEKMQGILDKYADEITKSGYTVHEILTLASLIETETKTSADRFKVSGVFHNRLHHNMRLDSDPTVKYALNKKEIQVTYKDTDVASPYNTYRLIGIPIGPIASPLEESIQAALQPEEMDEFYFFARPNGEVIYTKTLQEHEKVVSTYRHEWRKLIEEEKKATSRTEEAG